MKKYLIPFITIVLVTLLSWGIVDAAINISSNFNLSAGLPLDNRMATTTTTARDNIPTVQRFDGLFVYVTATDKTYQLQNGITNSDWVEWTVTGGSGFSSSTNPSMATYFVATSTTATSSMPLLSVQTALNFFGTFANSLDDLCVAITGGSGLCDGTDASGSGNGIATSTPMADTEIVYGTSVSTVGSEPAFTYDDATNKLTVVNASTTALSVSGTAKIDGATRIATSITGVLQAISGAVTATSTISQAFIDPAIARDSELHNAVTLSGALDYITLSGQDIIRGAIDLATDITGVLAISNGGTATTTQVTNGVNYFDGTKITSGTSLVYTGTNLGVGTSTPGSLFSIGGVANFRTATSTFYSTGGINLSSGCFSIGDVCVSHNAVTLAGTPDYITIAGQVITRALINLTTHVTGILPLANGGTGASAFGANRLPYLNSGGTAMTSTSTLVVTNDKNLGLGTTTPNNAIAIKRINEDAAINFQVENTAGGVGTPTETATTSPGTATDSGTPGISAWTSITNILTSNNVYAVNTAFLAQNDLSNFALATNYGFAIPAGSTITGVVVGVEADEELTDDFIDETVRLIIGGVQVGTDKSVAANYEATDTFHTFGGPADLWGVAPTVTDINASNFGVAVQFQCIEVSDCDVANMRLDTVQVKIYYTTTGGSTSDQTWAMGVDDNDGKFKISFGNVLGMFNLFNIASSTGQVSVTAITATSTTATSTLPLLTTTAISIAGTYISNFVNSVVAAIEGVANLNLSNVTVKTHNYPAFTYATTTWSGTTTIALAPAYNAEIWKGVKCFTNVGTLNVSFNDGTNRMEMFNASTTVGQITLNTNNTFTSSEKRYVDIGTPATGPTSISCSVDKIINN